MNRPARFTVADLRRAAKVAEEMGLAVEIDPDGTIRLVRKSDQKPDPQLSVEPFEDAVL